MPGSRTSSGLPHTYRCTYACAWVQVKYHYGLSVNSTEKSALFFVLNGC
ncbi:hypothetical protein [Streptomyces sp. 7N604]